VDAQGGECVAPLLDACSSFPPDLDGARSALLLLSAALSATSLVQMQKGAEFERRIYLISAGLTVVVVLWLYAEIAGITNYLDLMPR